MVSFLQFYCMHIASSGTTGRHECVHIRRGKRDSRRTVHNEDFSLARGCAGRAKVHCLVSSAPYSDSWSH